MPSISTSLEACDGILIWMLLPGSALEQLEMVPLMTKNCSPAPSAEFNLGPDTGLPEGSLDSLGESLWVRFQDV